MLIDDDEPTNFMNKKRIQEVDCTESIIVKENGEDAIDYLNELLAKDEALPELIFLDINMPGMNGWEFLEEYKKIEKNKKSNVLVIMLTTSLNTDDRERAEQIEDISDFINKPFLKERLEQILEANFSLL